jgi:hypothetical protein
MSSGKNDPADTDPTSSPDLARSDFFLFGYVKQKLAE